MKPSGPTVRLTWYGKVLYLGARRPGLSRQGQNAATGRGEERSAASRRNGPADHFERRTPRAKAGGRRDVATRWREEVRAAATRTAVVRGGPVVSDPKGLF